MHGGHSVERLHLDDHRVLDEKIDAEALVESNPVECEADRALALDVKPSASEH